MKFTIKKTTEQTLIDNKILELSKISGLYEFTIANCFLAGGAVRDIVRQKIPKDWDIFFKTDAAKDEFLAKFSGKMELTGFGNYNWKMFQFITMETGTPQKVTDTFDWNVNQVYYDFASSRFGGQTQDTMMHLMLNTKAKTPLSAIMRLPYFIEKGFKIDQKELLFCLTFISIAVNLTSHEAVSNQKNFTSGNGGEVGGIEGVIERAKKAALEQSPLCKALL